MRRMSTTTEEMKSYIAEGLLALMERKEYSSITVNQIVEKAGVHRSTYYRHFASKEDVLRYYLERTLLDYLQACASPQLTFETYILGLFRHYMTYKRQLLLLHKNGLTSLLAEVFGMYTYRLIPQDQDALEQFRAYYYVGGIFNMFTLWFARGMKDTPEAMTKYLLTILPKDYVSYLMPKKK